MEQCPDHVGSTSYITTRNGSISQHVEYIAFGEVLFEEHSSSFSSPYLFNGKELDRETNLSYYGARYLDMKTSIWLNVDPVAEKYPNVGGYVYAFNNPVRFIDPDGKEPILGWITGAIIGAATEYLGIIGNKMLSDGMSFADANRDLNKGDAWDIGVATVVGAAEGTIDEGIGRLFSFVSKARNRKILEFVAKVGIDALETGLKEFLKGTKYENVDVKSILAGSFAEVGLGELFKVDILKKEISSAEKKIADATLSKNTVKGTTKSTLKNIKKQEAIIKKQKQIINSMNQLNNPGNLVRGTVAKTGGNVIQDATKE